MFTEQNKLDVSDLKKVLPAYQIEHYLELNYEILTFSSLIYDFT